MYATDLPKSATVLAIIDQYEINNIQSDWQLINAGYQEAYALKAIAQSLGNRVQLHAIIERQDFMSLSTYSKADYHLHVMNGERSEALYDFVQTQLRPPMPQVLIVVSPDPAFDPLCLKARRAGSHVIVISPRGKASPILHRNGCDVRSLAAVLTTHRPPTKTIVFLDIENLLRSLCGGKGQRQFRLKAITAVLARLPQVTAIHAYGDFTLLARRFRCDVRGRLEAHGFVIHQTDNLRGKNSADMEMAADIQSTLAEQQDVTTFAIGTGDRDFRPVLQRAQAQGREIILLAPRNAVSSQLTALADQTFYVEHQPQVDRYQRPLSSLQQRCSAMNQKRLY